jgi:RNA polymerase sigma-70 factor (ECF subfamily)
VARNRCRTVRRDDVRRQKKAERVEQLELQRNEQVATSEQAISRKQQLEAVERALTALPSAQRETLLLKQLGELTYEQIGQMLGVPEGTIKSRLHQAIAALRRRLAKGGARP